ncbi:MAG: hypothetical protein ABI867_31025 [Kofleriaceae bacterium]
MAYRDDSGDVLEAPTAEGKLQLELGPRAIKLTVGRRTLHVVEKLATVIERRRNRAHRASFKIGRLITARDVPHEDLGVWIELPGGMRRIFGVEPVSLLEPEGLTALAALDKLALRLRTAVADHAGDIYRAIEIGRGLDKVLLADHGDRYVVYARRLFRDRARFAMVIHDDGRVIIHNGKTPTEVTVRSRFGITVVGDYVRFAAPDGRDLARISIPWITPEDRRELARRIGQLVDVSPTASRIGFPYLA